jgi:glycosyltransferase involved in cell wall biosynthesis
MNLLNLKPFSSDSSPAQDKIQQKRIGFLAAAPRISTHPDAEMSGPRSRILGLMSGFKEQGWQVRPFIVGDRVPQHWSARGSEAVVTRGGLRTLAVDLVRLSMGIYNTYVSWQELKHQVDWVYEYAATLQCLGWFFQRQGVPWILQAEALLFHEAKVDRKALILSRLAKWIELSAYRKCDVLACVSKTLRDILVQEFDIPPEKIVLVPNGVDTQFINPVLHSPKRVFSDFTIGFVGSLYAWAGLDLLIEAISELQTEGIKICLVVIGDGQMKSTWEQQVQALKLSEQITFLGRLTWQQVPQYIAGFDVGFSGQIQLQIGKMYLSPMKLYEYMAMAKPVIASAFEEACRLVTEGETGFLFEPGNKHELKEAIVKAFSQWESLPEMGNLARQEIELNHSWAARVEILEKRAYQILDQATSEH